MRRTTLFVLVIVLTAMPAPSFGTIHAAMPAVRSAVPDHVRPMVSPTLAIPITIRNYQSTATGYYQQKLDVESIEWRGYINSNWSNVNFEYASNSTPITSWIEANNSNVSTDTIVWLDLASIPGPGIVAINMTIWPKTSFEWSKNGQTGIAPQLSNVSGGAYAKFDNGWRVFPEYWNFSAPSQLTGWNIGGATGTASNGLHLTITGPSSYGWAGASWATSMYSSIPFIQDTYTYATVVSTDLYSGGSVATVPSSSNYQFNPYVGENFNAAGASWYSTGGSAFYHTAYGGLKKGTAVKIEVTYATANTTGAVSVNGSVVDKGAYAAKAVTPLYLTIGDYPTGAGSIDDWFLVRSYPPNGIMPSVTFGTPPAPTSLAVTSVDSTDISISWVNPAGTNTNVTAYAGTTCGTWTFSPSLGVGATAHTFGSLASNTKYCLAVRDWNSTGAGALAYTNGTTGPAPPTWLNASTPVTGTIPTSFIGCNAHMTAAGIYVFLSNWCSGTVVVIDTITNRVVKNISGVGVQPGAIGTSADGSSVYVTNCGSGPTPDNLSIISVVSLTITHVFHGVGGCSEKMGVAPNGTVVWLPNAVGVGEVSLTTGAILTTVTTTGGAKNELAITPDGSYLYAATTYTANISAINTATLTASNYRVTGASIGALTTSANGSYVYLADTGFNVSNAGFDTWSTTTHGLVHWINSTNFTGAQGMVRNPNGSYVVESNCGQPTDINVVNVLMNKVVESATLGHYGYDCAPRDAITLNGSFVYTIVGRNNLAAFVAVTQLSNPIDTTLYVSWKFPAGTLISGHVYVYDANCNNPLRTIALAASTEITVVTGLKPGTKYGFEVTANTSAGESTRSYCIGATTLGGSVTPGPSPKPAPGPTPPGPVIPATVIVTFLGLAVWQWFTVTMIVGLLLLLVSWARSRDRGGRSFRRGGD